MATKATPKLDYKKAFKDLYLPGTSPSIIEVPPIPFIMIDGTGDPNEEEGAYSQALEVLYGLTYTIKMSKMGGDAPAGYFEYVVPPLEGLWWIDGYVFDGGSIGPKDKFIWISLIRQPDFVTDEVFAQAQERLWKKKQLEAIDRARFETFEEGLCAQVMHRGSYDDEPATVSKLAAFISDEGYREDISDAIAPFPLTRRHHEIYLSDPRKAAPENLKTVIRHPIRKRP